MQPDKEPPAPRFDDSTVLKLLRLAQERDEKNEMNKEFEAQYIKALNAVAKTSNGAFVLRCMLRTSGIYSVESGSDIVKMADSRGRKNYFLQMVWNYLTPASKEEIK